MPALDDEMITGLAKLARRELPVKVLRAKYKLADLQEELDGVTRAAGGRRRYFRWLLPGLPAKDRKADELSAAIEAAKSDYVEGVLVPLTVADEQACDAFYFYASRNLNAHTPELLDQVAVDAWRDAVNFTLNHSMLCKRIALALKRKVRGATGQEQYEQVLDDAATRAMDPRLLWDLWEVYKSAFVVTEVELGKSVAPSPTV